MKKIISLYKRDYEGTRLVYDEVVPGAEWVLEGEGVATIKWDGACCMIRGGKLYKRYDAKNGKTPPDGFEPAQDADPVTGHWPGWVPVTDAPADRWFRDGSANSPDLPDGTYELCGPKVNGNPERIERHILIPHGKDFLFDAPRNFDDIRDYLKGKNIEGIVWHHNDGRMVKIKSKDFGIKRRPQ